VTVDDCRGEVDQLSVVDARVLAEHLERARLVDGVAFHEDALCSLDQGTSSERTLQRVEFREAL
jgi:hypothetical protein